MYSSRGIGRQTMSDRRPNDRDRQTSNRSPYQNSPDISKSDDRDYDHKNNNDRPKYGDRPSSPDNDSYGTSSKRSSTPSGAPPPKAIPLQRDQPPTHSSYVPTPSVAKPLQPYSPNPELKYGSNQGYEPNRTPKYTPNSTPSVSSNSYSSATCRPNTSQLSLPSSSRVPYGRVDQRGDEDDDRDPTPEEIKEKLWKQRTDMLFLGVNSIDDLITLKEQYHQKLQSLQTILDRSNTREGEILRNKRRNRDDFKDPAMLELRKMQSDIRVKIEEVSKFRVEIDKRIRAYNKLISEHVEKVIEEVPDQSFLVKPNNYEAQLLQNSLITTTVDEEDGEEEEDEFEYENSTKEYFDPGSHWCRDCDRMVPKINEFFDHLHSKEHLTTANNDLKPWKKLRKAPVVEASGYAKPTKIKTALKGVQFLIPLRGFYCPLCKDYLADNSMAEEHMRGAKHNRIYNRFICLHMDYEQKWNTDKGKALSRYQLNERKKKEEEEQKELEKRKKSDEQKQKEEKETKKRKREEEHKRKEKEEREKERQRERDEYKKSKSSAIYNSSDRFRLKEVTLDLKGGKSSSHKEKERGREREKDKSKKRTRIYSSSASSKSPSPPPDRPLKKKTWFGDPYKDPMLTRANFVKLIPLNRATAKQFRCKELLNLIEDAKNRPKDKPKIECKTEITIANSPIRMEIDMNDDENDDNKLINSLVAGVLENLIEDSDRNDDSITRNGVNKLNSNENENSVNLNQSEESLKTLENNCLPKIIQNFVDDYADKSDNTKADVPQELDSDPKLEIDFPKELTTEDNDENSDEIKPKKSDSSDKEVGEQLKMVSNLNTE